MFNNDTAFPTESTSGNAFPLLVTGLLREVDGNGDSSLPHKKGASSVHDAQTFQEETKGAVDNTKNVATIEG